MSDDESLEALIDRLVILENFPFEISLDLKIALLMFALDRLKHDRRANGDEVGYEEFVQCNVDVRGGKLVIEAPNTFRDLGSGTAPIQLQAPLLMFLLLNHRERYQVLDIIKLFVEQMRKQLSVLDFKKTKTGVTRCFTNTRFAAHVLRDYGLLKFTRREAFKTWELSLTGFLVAADILQKRSRERDPWQLSVAATDKYLNLLPEILHACDAIRNFDAFIARLTSICEPDATIFKTFKPALKQAYDLLEGYWALLSDRSKSHEERREACLERVRCLDALGDEFFHELSRCIQINDALRRILQSRKDS